MVTINRPHGDCHSSSRGYITFPPARVYSLLISFVAATVTARHLYSLGALCGPWLGSPCPGSALLNAQEISQNSQVKGIVHILSPYVVSDCDARFCPYEQSQSLAVASARRARDYSSSKKGGNGVMARVTLAASVFPEDDAAVPGDFVRLPDLVRSTNTEYPDVDGMRRLPFLNDIFLNLKSATANLDPYDYVVYTNADIILSEDFYEIVASAIDDGLDAFTINRLTVSKKKQEGSGKGGLYTASDLDEIFKLKGGKHPGSDCFVMKKNIFDQIDMGNLFLGYPPVAPVLLIQVVGLATNFTMFESHNLNATFHLGDDRNWKASGTSSKEIKQYNDINFRNAFVDLRHVWSMHCQLPTRKTKKKGKINQRNWHQMCPRLIHRFERFYGENMTKSIAVEPRKASHYRAKGKKTPSK